MKKENIIIGGGVLLIGIGIAYYFLSMKKEKNNVDSGGIVGVSMNKMPTTSRKPFTNNSTVRTIRTPIQNAEAFSRTKKNLNN